MKHFDSPEMNLLVFVFGTHRVTQPAGCVLGGGTQHAVATAGLVAAAGGCAGAMGWVVSARFFFCLSQCRSAHFDVCNTKHHVSVTCRCDKFVVSPATFDAVTQTVSGCGLGTCSQVPSTTHLFLS